MAPSISKFDVVGFWQGRNSFGTHPFSKGDLLTVGWVQCSWYEVTLGMLRYLLPFLWLLLWCRLLLHCTHGLKELHGLGKWLAFTVFSPSHIIAEVSSGIFLYVTYRCNFIFNSFLCSSMRNVKRLLVYAVPLKSHQTSVSTFIQCLLR